MKIIAIILLFVSAYLILKQGWEAFQPATAEQIKAMSHLGTDPSIMPYFGVLSLLIGLMLFIPQTFVLANVLHAMIYVLIIALLLKAGDYILALIEIVFVAMPLLMIKLKYPFKR